jgi:hypothetical protein
MRHLLSAVVFAVALVAGFWFGGGEGLGVPVAAIVAAGVCVLAADLLGSPESQNARIGAAAMAGVLFACGWYLGGRELESAVDECLQRGEEVRAVIEEHRTLNGQYPESLDGLAAYEVPGDRVLRPSPIRYLRSGDGYQLWISDGTSRFTASAERGFFARESSE